MAESPFSGTCGLGGLDPGFREGKFSSPAVGIGMGLDILPRIDRLIFWRPVPVADRSNPSFI